MGSAGLSSPCANERNASEHMIAGIAKQIGESIAACIESKFGGRAGSNVACDTHKSRRVDTSLVNLKSKSQWALNGMA